MKLIIDIPEERLNSIKRFGIKQNEVSMTERALISGTPFNSVIEDIKREISADVRPNIHGHWMKINSGDEDFPESIVCDKCNHENSHLDFNEHNEPIGKVFVTSNFCPNCGADMRGNTDAER